MKINQVAFAAGKSAFFFDDQRAIKAGAGHDGFVYTGAPITSGFSSVRQAGEALSILLLLEDGQVAVGDCAAVQYSGAGGRDPLFLAEAYRPLLEKEIRPRLVGREISAFRALAAEFESLIVDGRRLHTAVRYGLSQALLAARAAATGRLACEVVAEEYELPRPVAPVPIFGQSGDDRYSNVDKMILKQVDALPHGLINNVSEKLGERGEKLSEYIRWLVKRIEALRPDATYRPALHLDVYGTIGLAFGGDLGQVGDYLASLEADAGDFALYIEGPVDLEEKPRQIAALAEIRAFLRARGSLVKIVADEWCNTLEDVREFADAQACDMAQIKTPDLGGLQNTAEAVLYCRTHGVEAYQGGTCNETDVSARACAQVALATRPERLLAKPGMGFDEGFTIVHNEMARALAVLRMRD